MDKNTSSSNVFTQNNNDTDDHLPVLKKPKLVRLTNADPIPPKRETNPDNGSSSTTQDPLKY